MSITYIKYFIKYTKRLWNIHSQPLVLKLGENILIIFPELSGHTLPSYVESKTRTEALNFIPKHLGGGRVRLIGRFSSIVTIAMHIDILKITALQWSKHLVHIIEQCRPV
jgi:hypothetical protein